MMVTTPAAFAAALKACVAACSIALVGVFPRLDVSNRPATAAPVTIDASGATIAMFTAYHSNHVTVNGGVFGPAQWASATITDSDDMAMNGGVYLSPATTGIAVMRSTHIALDDNRITHSSGDGIDIGASQFVTVRRTVCLDNVVTLIHPDCVQSFSPPLMAPTSDVTVTDTLAIGAMQGVTAFDHPDQGQRGFARMTFSRNFIATSDPQCIALYDATASVVTDNVCHTLLGTKVGFAPVINVIDRPVGASTPASGNVVSGNVAGLKP